VLAVSGEEQAVLDAIAATRSTITTLYQQRVADEEVVSSLVYTLAVTRCFGFTTAKGPPMTSPAFARKAAQGVTPTTQLGAGNVTSLPPMSLGIASTDPPPMAMSSPPVSLGLALPSGRFPGSAAPPAWKPARVPVSDVVQPGVRPLPEPVHGGEPRRDSLLPRLSAPPAAALPVPATAVPAASTPPGSPPAEEAREPEDEAERALEAMGDFRRADTALQRNDLATAERLAKKAVEGDPDNAEYRALVAWLTALSGTKEAVKEALHGLSGVLKDDALCERALLYRGKLLKKENRNSEAMRDFMTVLDVNPKNSEAASEVRLLRMKKKK